MADLGFKELAAQPLLSHIKLGTRSESTAREWLDAVDPVVLYVKLEQGLTLARRAYKDSLRPDADPVVASFCSRVQESTTALAELWAKLDEHEREGIWKGVLAHGSDDAIAGGLVGHVLLPGIGGLLGTVVGGLVTARRIDAEARRTAVVFQSAFETWCIELDAQLAELERAIVRAQDPEDRGHHRMGSTAWGCVLFVFVVGTAIGGCVWIDQCGRSTTTQE